MRKVPLNAVKRWHAVRRKEITMKVKNLLIGLCIIGGVYTSAATAEGERARSETRGRGERRVPPPHPAGATVPATRCAITCKELIAPVDVEM